MHKSPGMSKAAFRVLSGSLLLAPADAFAQGEPCVQPPSGLVSWWPGNGDAGDVADHNAGSPLNGATFEAGLVQQGFAFDGVDDLVSVPAAPNLDLREALTLEAWVRPAETTASLFRLILGKPTGYQLIILPDGRLRFAFPIEGGGLVNRGVDSTSLLSGGVFVHVAATFDSATGLASVYVNGALENSAAQPGPIDSVGTPVQMGGFADPTFIGSFLSGIVDEATIYNRALSDAEILSIAVAGPAGKCSAPRADAGPDQVVNEGDEVMLDGSSSRDPLDRVLTWVWKQIAGPEVALDLSDPVRPVFVAPVVPAGGTTLTFQLVVSNGLTNSAPDEVAIAVLGTNDPPACDLVRAVPEVLWPPDHKLVEVSIAGVSDPEGDPVTIRVTRVTQDEPVSGSGGGDSSPDAVVQDQGLLLRAERSGGGNGRVYVVHFSAADPDGAECTGTARVISPENRSGEAVDDGQAYDSTLP